MIHKVRKHRELHTISVNTKTTDAFPPVSFTPIITYAQSHPEWSVNYTVYTCGESTYEHLKGNVKAFDFRGRFCLNDSEATDRTVKDTELSKGL